MKETEVLSEEQRVYATEHHNLIYKYLHSHGLSVDDYYDVVVFGYLKACKRYLEQEDLQQRYSFATIAWRNMDWAVKNEYKKISHQRRNVVLMNIDEDMGLLLADPCIESSELNAMWHTLRKNMTDKQLQVVMLQYAGYDAKEIGTLCGDIDRSSVYKLIYRMRLKTRALADVFLD